MGKTVIFLHLSLRSINNTEGGAFFLQRRYSDIVMQRWEIARYCQKLHYFHQLRYYSAITAHTMRNCKKLREDELFSPTAALLNDSGPYGEKLQEIGRYYAIFTNCGIIQPQSSVWWEAPRICEILRYFHQLQYYSAITAHMIRNCEKLSYLHQLEYFFSPYGARETARNCVIFTNWRTI